MFLWLSSDLGNFVATKGGAKTNNIFILGRKRKIFLIGQIEMVNVMGVPTKLSDALKEDKKYRNQQ